MWDNFAVIISIIFSFLLTGSFFRNSFSYGNSLFDAVLNGCIGFIILWFFISSIIYWIIS